MLTKRELLRSAALAAIDRRDNDARPGERADQGGMARHPQGQSHRRGRLHLRPADRDELRCHVRVCRRQELGAIQGAVQSDQERGARLHLQGHGHHHAQQRYALFLVWLDLRAEPIVLSVPAVEKSRYYSVHALRRQYLQLRLYRQPRHRQRGRGLHGGRPRLEGRDPARHQEGVSVHDAIFCRGLSHPALRSG